jgi:predicted CXXCH cytochrome family protein
VQENCVNCHNPHSETNEFLLPQSTPDLCYGCHSELAEHKASPVPHQPVAEGKCGSCHDSHATDHPNMFKIAQEQLCFSCHVEMGRLLSDKEHKHGPVTEGDCNACHDPHGSTNYRILKQYFPEEFYMPYSADNYAACFACHNESVVQEPNTTTLTDFRDGDINLHYLHVNKEVKGRSCKACHEAHATAQAKHIRNSVPYGSMDWELPVTFTKFDDGGNCVVGCHGPKDYRR